MKLVSTLECMGGLAFVKLSHADAAHLHKCVFFQKWCAAARLCGQSPPDRKMSAVGRTSSSPEMSTETDTDKPVPTLPAGLWGYEGQRYDLTEFATVHPGGRELIESTRGADITVLVNTYHPQMTSKKIRQRISAHWRGGGAPCRHRFATGAPMYDELRDVVCGYIKYNGCKGFDHIGWTLFFSLACASMVIFGAQTMSQGGLWNSMVFGVCMWLVCADCAHSGAHCAISRNRTDNQLLSRTIGAYFSVSSQWLRQHVISHHIDTNGNDDPDIWHHPGAALPWRVSERVPWRPAFARWRYHLLATIWMTQIVPSVYYTAVMITRGLYIPTKKRVIWSSGERRRAVTELTMTLIILALMLIRNGLMGIVPNATCGTLYYVFSQVSHASEPASGRDAKEWAAEQLTVCGGDWSLQSYAASFLSIGLNNQALHHLFPTVHHAHHVRLMRLIAPVLHKYGYDTSKRHATLQNSLAAHFKHLDTLNRWREVRAIQPADVPYNSDDETPPE